ncbi:MAG TPA: AIM24 family protein [Candidatus Dormibacteraeota bacterium]|nr:AIM24 family protein [Candidatus Dormibacteraeota bacterium]
MASYTCRWCRSQLDLQDQVTCPMCGAPVDVRAEVTRSGWSELPAIPDMARIQCGRSVCQIEGTFVPVADFNLAPGDGVYFAHHVLLWREDSVSMSTMSLRGALKRVFAGMPVVMAQAHGPGHVAFSHDSPGEVVALPLQPGMAVDVREHLFMVATLPVAYDWFQTGVWFQTADGDERETHYPLGMYMDRFSAPREPGLLLLYAAGNAFVRDLGPGETLLVKPTALLYKDAGVQMQLHFERPAGTWRAWRTWGERYVWLRLHGPGRVAVHSAYGRFEDPGSNLVRSSPATSWSWQGPGWSW